MAKADHENEMVETISGTISGGTIQFTRELAGQQTQVYAGLWDGSTYKGSFDHNGQGQYPWSASRV